MNQTELMITTLEGMIRDSGEILLCPIYCYQKSHKQTISFHPEYCYMGMTESKLLIGIVQDGHLVNADIIALSDILSVKTDKERFGQKKINIRFRNHEPLIFIASPKVLGLKSQPDNLPEFISRLENAATKKTPPDLNATDGKKIRHQFFNAILCLFSFGLYVCTVILAWELFEALIKGNASAAANAWQELVVAILTYTTVILSPLLLLSLSNRLFFGETICIAGKDGLYLENDFRKWDDIKQIAYTPNFMGRFTMEYCSLSVTLKDDNSFNIQHFPFYGMRIIKKYAPHVKTGISKMGWIIIALYFLFPIALVAFFMLVL